MRKQKHIPKNIITNIFVLGAVVVAVGAIMWFRLPDIAGWPVASGGLLMAGSFLISAFQRESTSVRRRRLERMRLFSALLYLVSGGFMIQGSGSWFPMFLIGTVFFVYSAFVRDKEPTN